MVEAGAGHGIGIDPGVHPERIETDVDPSRLTWIKDFYTEQYAHLDADAILAQCCLDPGSCVQPEGRAAGKDERVDFLQRIMGLQRVGRVREPPLRPVELHMCRAAGIVSDRPQLLLFCRGFGE